MRLLVAALAFFVGAAAHAADTRIIGDSTNQPIGNVGDALKVVPGAGAFIVLPGSAPIVAVGSVTVTGPGGAAVAVSGPITDAQLRAVAVPISAASLPTHGVTQSGTWDIGTVTTLPSLPAGTANIGRVNGSTITVQCMNAAGTALESCAGGGSSGVSTVSVAVDSTTKTNPTWVVTASTPTVQVINSTLTVVGVNGAAVAVSGPLTDAQLRATAVPVSIPTSGSTFTVVGIGGAAVAVSGPVTDAQLRATAVPVSLPGAFSMPATSTYTVVVGTGAAAVSYIPVKLVDTGNSFYNAGGGGIQTVSVAVDSFTAANAGYVRFPSAQAVTIPASGSTFTVVGVAGAPGVLVYGTMTVVGASGGAVAISAASLPTHGVTLPASGSTWTVVGVAGAPVVVNGTMTMVGVGGLPVSVQFASGSFTNALYVISTNTAAPPLVILTRSSQTVSAALGSVRIFPSEPTRRSFEIWTSSANTDSVLCDWTDAAVSTSPIVIPAGGNYVPTLGCPTQALNCTSNNGAQVIRGISYGP